MYRISIVERDFPYGHPQSKIIDFKEDFEYKSSKQLQKKWYSLKKQGYTQDNIDITVWNDNGFLNELRFDDLSPRFK